MPNGVQAGLSSPTPTAPPTTPAPWRPTGRAAPSRTPTTPGQGMATQLNGGACDGFLVTQPTGDLFPIGYYRRGTCLFSSRWPPATRLFDHYFASMLGPTWPNRLYQLSATTDLDATGLFPATQPTARCNLETAIFDRLRDAGLTGGYYTLGEPMTELFASGKYDDLTYPIDQFWSDAKAGTLPNVTFVDPDYTARSELDGHLERLPPLRQRAGSRGLRRPGARRAQGQPAVGAHGVRPELRRGRRVLRPRSAAQRRGRHRAPRPRARSRTSSSWASGCRPSPWARSPRSRS